MAETKSLSLEWCPILGDLGSQYYRDRALWMLSGRIHGDTRVWTSGNGLCFTSAPCLVMAAKSKSCVSHSGGHDAIPHTHTHTHTHSGGPLRLPWTHLPRLEAQWWLSRPSGHPRAFPLPFLLPSVERCLKRRLCLPLCQFRGGMGSLLCPLVNEKRKQSPLLAAFK